VAVRRHLPQLLQSDAELLRLTITVESETLQQRLGEAAARAFCKQSVFGAQLHATGEIVSGLAVLADAHVAGGDTGDRTVGVVEHLGGSKARINLDAGGLGLGREPSAHIAER